MNDGWPRRKLKTLASHRTDRGTADFKLGLDAIESWTGMRVATESDFDGEGLAFEAGDVLFGKLRPYLAKVWLADRSGSAVGDFLVIRPGREIRPALLSRFLTTSGVIEEVSSAAFGSKMPRTDWGDVRELSVPIPDLLTQDYTIDFLDRETAEIDEFNADQEELIALLAERRAAAVRQVIDTAGRAGRVPLKAVATFVSGATPESDDESLWADEGTPWLSIGDMRTFESTGVPTRFVTAAGLASARLRPAVGEIVLFAMYASVGEVALITRPAVWNQAILGIVSQGGDAAFLRYSLEAMRPRLNELFRSNTQNNMNAQQVANLRVPDVPVPEQHRIVARLDAETSEIDGAIANAREAIALSKERRSALISAAVTGQIDVTDRYAADAAQELAQRGSA